MILCFTNFWVDIHPLTLKFKGITDKVNLSTISQKNGLAKIRKPI